MPGYLEILRAPGVARIITAQLAARMPGGMISLALLLHVERQHGSYGAAGLVLAALSVGMAVAGPLTSRWMVFWGMRPVLILTMSVSALALVVLIVAPLPVPAQMAVALVCGLSSPPVQSAVRTIYPKMVNAQQLTPLFSLDASAQEIIWTIGPVVATFLATQVSTTVALVVVLAFLVGGGIWFISSPEVGRVRIPRTKRRFGVVLARPTVLVSTLVGFLLVGSFGALEPAVVAVFGHDDWRSGVVLAIWSIASLAGGLLFGKVGMSPWSLARRIFLVFVGTALTLAMLDFWWLSFALVISGLGIAPAMAVMFASISVTVRFSDTAEAYGWAGTGQLLGAALGAALAGFAIDGFGPLGGFAAAAGFALLGAVLAALFHRAMPDLRGRDAAPRDDTEPIQTQTG